MFVPPSNPPSSYDHVSVAAENIVGVGAARTCTAQTISELIFVITYVQNHSWSATFMPQFTVDFKWSWVLFALLL